MGGLFREGMFVCQTCSFLLDGMHMFITMTITCPNLATCWFKVHELFSAAVVEIVLP